MRSNKSFLDISYTYDLRRLNVISLNQKSIIKVYNFIFQIMES